MNYLEDLILRQLTRQDHYDEIVTAMRNSGGNGGNVTTQTLSGNTSELDISRILEVLGDIRSGIKALSGGINALNEDKVNILNASILLPRGATGQVITVGVTPVRIIDGANPTAYIILNPLAVTSPSTGTLQVSTAVTGAGDTTVVPLGVGNYNDLHLYLRVLAINASGIYNFFALTKDPVTGLWFKSQTIFQNISAVDSYYAYLGRLGVASNFAVSWEKVSGTGMTFSIGYVLKDGQPGDSTGLSSTIYLGNQDVNTNGFPLLEGTSKIFFPTSGTDLYAIATATTSINIYKF